MKYYCYLLLVLTFLVSTISCNQVSIESKIKNVKTKVEAEKLINGTTWHYTENLSTSEIGNWIKVTFNNGKYITYYANPADGEWTKGGEGSYKIEEGRYSNTGEKYISVLWEGDMIVERMIPLSCEFALTLDNFQLNITSKMLDGISHMNNLFSGMDFTSAHYSAATRKKANWTGQMKFGDYIWK